ncbi:hypothetical protein D3C76_1670910 [compost metagenome]
MQPLEFAAPDGFNVAIPRLVAITAEGYGADLQTAIIGSATHFHSVAGGSGLAQHDLAGFCPGSRHAFAHFVAEAGQAAEHGFAAGEGGLVL